MTYQKKNKSILCAATGIRDLGAEALSKPYMTDEDMNWISVKDKLPEEGVSVLVITPSGCVGYGVRDRDCYEIAFSDKGYRGIERGILESEGDRSATYWMPLPEVPYET